MHVVHIAGVMRITVHASESIFMGWFHADCVIIAGRKQNVTPTVLSRASVEDEGPRSLVLL